MALTIYNTLTRRKEPFEPIDRKNVRMYVCGPTVYDFAHIGNARPVVVFDILYRLLRHTYGEDHVTYARNITDVDDKIIAAAKEMGEDISAITERYTDAFHADMAALGALPPDVEPRATAHIPEMIALVEALIVGGHAYAAEGHVLFSVDSMADYGKLSRHSRAELIDGARVEVAPYKKDPADFVLWKPSSADQPGWDSPWGFGRPGWHLECSAMSEKHLGIPFDIHGGGRDLIFPHHENEIAQSRCAHDGTDFARGWMHNGYLTVEGEKMSKSLGNFFTVRDLLALDKREFVAGETIRLALLKTNYRRPLDWNQDAFDMSKSNLDRWYRLLKLANDRRKDYEFADFETRFEYDVPPDVRREMEDDLNTSGVIVAMNDIADEGFRTDNLERLLDHAGQLRAAGTLIGILGHNPDDWFKKAKTVSVGMDAFLAPSDQTVEEQIAERAEARAAKNFKRADEIREELAEYGVILEDRPGGSTDWRRV